MALPENTKAALFFKPRLYRKAAAASRMRSNTPDARIASAANLSSAVACALARSSR